MTDLLVFDSRGVYKELSNNFPFTQRLPIVFDTTGEALEYKTVTHYVYSNLLTPTPMHDTRRRLLRNARNPEELGQSHQNVLSDAHNQEDVDALFALYNTIFTDRRLAEILVNRTKRNPIIFRSSPTTDINSNFIGVTNGRENDYLNSAEYRSSIVDSVTEQTENSDNDIGYNIVGKVLETIREEMIGPDEIDERKIKIVAQIYNYI